MRQVYRAGEKGFVDYSGKRPCITDATTGEKIPVELFVAVLGASSFTYAEATLTQKGRGASHVRAMEYWGGAPMLLGALAGLGRGADALSLVAEPLSCRASRVGPLRGARRISGRSQALDSTQHSNRSVL